MSVVTLRLPEDLKRRLSALARARGESLNHLLESIAVQALVAEETTRRVLVRRGRGSVERAIAVLARAPDRRPLVGDELPSATARSPSKRRRRQRPAAD